MQLTLFLRLLCWRVCFPSFLHSLTHSLPPCLPPDPDPQARNILLKSSGGAEGRPFVAKVADFGLSMRIDPNATHVSNVYQVRDTHTQPRPPRGFLLAMSAIQLTTHRHRPPLVFV